jgi:hypothetical protein
MPLAAGGEIALDIFGETEKNKGLIQLAVDMGMRGL